MDQIMGNKSTQSTTSPLLDVLLHTLS